MLRLSPPPGEPVAPAAVEALSNLFAKFNREADAPSVAAATDATTSTRRLDSGNNDVVPETLTGLPLPAPAAPKSKKVKFFEKTAGARATRSNNPTILRGMATSTGFGINIHSLNLLLESGVKKKARAPGRA